MKVLNFSIWDELTFCHVYLAVLAHKVDHISEISWREDSLSFLKPTICLPARFFEPDQRVHSIVIDCLLRNCTCTPTLSALTTAAQHSTLDMFKSLHKQLFWKSADQKSMFKGCLEHASPPIREYLEDNVRLYSLTVNREVNRRPDCQDGITR